MSKPLDNLGSHVYAILHRRLGYIRKPQPVPHLYIQKALKTKGIETSLMSIQRRIKRLIQLGYLEKWTVKHPTNYKMTYYRIPIFNKIDNTLNRLPNTKKTPTTSSDTHASNSAYADELKETWSRLDQIL